MCFFGVTVSLTGPWLSALVKTKQNKNSWEYLLTELILLVAFLQLTKADTLTLGELQKAFNAKKDFRYPEATEGNCYNPQIISQKSNLHFEHHTHLTVVT